jgi:hypothetical protein
MLIDIELISIRYPGYVNQLKNKARWPAVQENLIRHNPEWAGSSGLSSGKILMPRGGPFW